MGAVEEYRRFLFAKSRKFRLFVSRLDNSILAHSQELVKRLFYKYFIHEQFNVNFDGNFEDFTDKRIEAYLQKSKEDAAAAAAAEAKSQKCWYRTPIGKLLFGIESYMKLFFIAVTLLTLYPLHGSLPTLNFLYLTALAASILAIIRQFCSKNPLLMQAQKKSKNKSKKNQTILATSASLSKESTMIPPEFSFTNLNNLSSLLQFHDARQFLYLIVFLFYENQRGMLLYFLPLCCTFLFDISQYLFIRQTVLLFLFEKQINTIIQKRYYISQLETCLQALLVVVLAYSAIFGQNGSCLLLIIYVQFLRTITENSAQMKRLFGNLNMIIMKGIHEKYLPLFVERLYFSFVVLVTGKLPKDHQKAFPTSKRKISENYTTTKQQKKKTD